MKIHWLHALLLGTLVLSAASRAEDIDLFLENQASSVGTPNVLLGIDNSANWNANLYQLEDGTKVTKKSAVHDALYRAFTSASFRNRLQAGLMLFASGNSPKGSKIFAGVKKLDETYQNTLASMVYDADSNELLPGTNNAPYALSVNEAYRYFAGLSPRSGLQDGNHDHSAVGSDGNYISPAHDPDNVCANNYLIIIGNGGPDSGENNEAESVLSTLGGKLRTDPIPLTPKNYESNWADEFARFLTSVDVSDEDGTQFVTTYVIDVFDPDEVKTLGDRAERAFLWSIADSGRGRYFAAKNADEILLALQSIIDEIQAINSVFASTTLPVSVNVRGTNLNQVYMGVFRPDANALPRWFGNLKLYQLAVHESSDTVFLADRNNNPAENQSTGFIVNDAVSFWTTPSTYWEFSPRGSPASASDSPDGEVVEKGAAAQKLRARTTTRNIYTCAGSCTSGSALSGMPFASSNSAITTTALGADSTTERADIINWVRGDDNKSDENNNGALDDMRASVHGDVLHSRPAVINFNRDGAGNGDILVFYGANDGVFRALKGGKDESDGGELWGFVPEEFFGKLKRLRDNTTDVLTQQKPYFVDGNIGVYQHDANGDGQLIATDGDKVHLFLSMRRGGRLLYALDVSNPDAPRLLWRRDNNSTGYGELGQTWSEPRFARINLNGTSKNVVIFGAGYDPDANDVHPAGTATMGRGIFIVDAATGSVIWQAGPSPTGATYNHTVSGMTYSIPSDVTAVNRDGDIHGYVDRLYVGDTGGNLWRVDLSDPNPSNWRVDRFGAVGGGRKFLYPPDVVYGSDVNGLYDAILIGSGDREHPFDTSVVNRFYMFKDRGPSSDWPLTESALYDATANLIQDGNDTEQQVARAALNGANGWYITLGSGEKVVGNAVTLSGTTFFNTSQPSPSEAGVCSSNLGTARNYAVSYEDATATTELNGIAGLTVADRSSEHAGGGFPPSPVPVIVDIDGKKHQAVVSGTKVMSPPQLKLEARSRIYWYKSID